MPNKSADKHIGTLLLELGRISEADIERALEHQRLQGGYFGQALVDLGVLQQEELDFTLATQANLPYELPEPDTIDAAVAGLVPPGWAVRHNAMPIRREGGWITLLVDSPLKSGLADELAARTGDSVKLALCSGARLRELIRTVYQLESVREAAGDVLSLEAFWTLASSPPATRWGLSIRQDRVFGWIDRNGERERHALTHNWAVFLDRLLSPPPSQLLPAHGLRQWRATVRPDHWPVAVTVQSVSGPGGHEFLFVPAPEPGRDIVGLPGASQLAPLREAVRRGRTAIGLRSPTGRMARNICTQLPRLLMPRGHRSVCLLQDGAYTISDDVLLLSLPPEGGEEDWISALEPLALDAVVAELSPSTRKLWQRTLALAPVVVMVLSGPHDSPPPPDLDWLLSTPDDERPDWRLTPSNRKT